MSVDRGFLGRPPLGGGGGGMDNDQGGPGIFKSMDDLSAQKATGLELVRLLREAEQVKIKPFTRKFCLSSCQVLAS